MATSVKKLIISDELTAEQVVGYLRDAQAAGDYYSEEGQAFMRWVATDRVRALFALPQPGQGEVSGTVLAMLMKGVDPITGEVIRRAGSAPIRDRRTGAVIGREQRMVGGIDLTVSPAPKSVSVLWALGNDKLRYELERMVGLSVNRAVNRMLEDVPLVRERYGPGQHDVRRVVVEDHIGVQVLHSTARLAEGASGVPDPQLHVHNVLIAAVDAAGKLRAFESRAIHQHRAELDAEAQGYLVEMLRARGFQIEWTLARKSTGALQRVAWEIKGVPAGLVKAMSSRSLEIEELKKRYQQEYGKKAEGEAWNRWFAEHRGPKAKLTAGQLREAWGGAGAEHGFGPQQAAQLVELADAAMAAGIPPAEERETGPEADEFRKRVLVELCREHALVPARDLDRLAQVAAVGLVSPTAAMGIVAEMIGDGDILITADAPTDTEGQGRGTKSTSHGWVTTLEVLAAEQRAEAAATQLLESELEAVPEVDLRAELARREREGRPFDPEQARAIRIATSGARLVSIAGDAGSGKGYASEAMTTLWQAQGRRVIAVAVAGSRAQAAGADAGADLALTLDGLRERVRRGQLVLSGRDVLLVDEAGLVDHERYAWLLETAAASGVKVTQLGDDAQLSPVQAGGLWRPVHEMANERGLAAHLRHVYRARDGREAEAWTEIREGSVEVGLTWYLEQDRLKLYDDRRQLQAGMVAEWWGSWNGLEQEAEAEAKPPVMLVDTSNQERDELNRLAQARRVEAGEVGEAQLEVREGVELRGADRVVFSAIHKPNWDAGERWKRVENGTEAVVLEVDPGRRRALLELHEAGGQTRRLEVGPGVPVELGYCRHIFKGQGVTAECAELAVSDHTGRNELYTMVSRSRSGSRVHALRSDVDELTAETAEEAARKAPARFEFRERRDAESLAEYSVARDMAYREAAQAAGARLEFEFRPPRESESATEYQVLRELARQEAEVAQGAAAPHAEQAEGRVYIADIEAEVREQRERDLVEVRRMGEQASRPSTKTAVGRRVWNERVDVRDERQQTRGRREAERNPDTDRKFDPDTERFWEHSWQPERQAVVQPGEGIERERSERGARREEARRRQAERDRRASPRAMPAREAKESVARAAIEDGRIAEGVGRYRSTGRLAYSADPEQRVVELMAKDREAVIVVSSAEQERRVREEMARRPELAGASEAGRVVQAERAYEERHARREQWWEANRDTPGWQLERPEPEVVSRAYVIADRLTEEWRTSVELTKALSVAAESHLVTRPPKQQLEEKITAAYERQQAAESARGAEETVRRREEGRGAYYQRGVKPEVQHEVQREPEHAASRADQRSAWLRRSRSNAPEPERDGPQPPAHGVERE